MEQATTNISEGTKLRLTFGKAPKPLQDLFFSDEYSQNIKAVGEKMGLEKEKISKLAHEINNIILGMQPLSSFRSNLVQNAGFTYDQALKVSVEVNSQIFSPVMDAIRSIQEGNVPVKPEQKPASMPVATAAPTPKVMPTEPARVSMPKFDVPKPEPVQTKAAPAFMPQLSKSSRPGQSQDLQPDHLLMDHEGTEAVDGPHLHSQAVMPNQVTTPKKSFFVHRAVPQTSRAAVTPVQSNPQPQIRPTPAQSVPPRTAPPTSSLSASLKSIDDKLNNIVRSPSFGNFKSRPDGAPPRPAEEPISMANDGEVGHIEGEPREPLV